MTGRKPLIPHAELRRLAQRLVSIQERLDILERSSRATQLPFASIDGGAITIRDSAGIPRGYIGMQPDGSSGTRIVGGPAPSRPDTPTVSALKGGVSVTWNGQLFDGPPKGNFSHVLVYASGAGPDFVHGPSNLVGTLSRAGSIPVSPVSGPHWARFVAVSTSGKESEPSLTGGPAEPAKVVGDDLLDGIIDTLKLAEGAVKGPNIAAEQIIGTHLIAEAITSRELAALSVIADKIAANAIETGHISAGAITADKLAALLVIAGTEGGNRVQISQGSGIEQWLDGERTLWIPPNGRAMFRGSLFVGDDEQFIDITPEAEDSPYPRIRFVDDDVPDRRAAIYFINDSLWLRRETIIDDVGEVRGGQLALGADTHLTNFQDATGAYLGAVDLYESGRSRILGRSADGTELGAWDIQETGHCWLTAERGLNIDARGNGGGDLSFHSNNNMWFVADGDCNYEAGAVFLRNNQDPDGDDFCQIALYGNGETELWINGDSHGALVGWDDIKPFVIDHPDDPDRFLVHACIEGPTADLLYRGEAEIVDGEAVVELPGYFESAARPDGRQVQLTPIDEMCLVAASRIEDGRFVIRCSGPDGTRVSWLVTAIRADVVPFEVEPRKDEVVIRGDGPYRYLIKK